MLQNANNYEVTFCFPDAPYAIDTIVETTVEPLWECHEQHFVGLFRIVVRLTFSQQLVEVAQKGDVISIDAIDMEGQQGYFEYALPFEGEGDLAQIVVPQVQASIEKEHRLQLSWRANFELQPEVEEFQPQVAELQPEVEELQRQVTESKLKPKPQVAELQRQVAESKPKPQVAELQRQVAESKPKPQVAELQRQVAESKPKPQVAELQRQVTESKPKSQVVEDTETLSVQTSAPTQKKQSNIFMNDLVEQFSIWRSSDLGPQKKSDNNKE